MRACTANHLLITSASLLAFARASGTRLGLSGPQAAVVLLDAAGAQEQLESNCLVRGVRLGCSGVGLLLLFCCSSLASLLLLC